MSSGSISNNDYEVLRKEMLKKDFYIKKEIVIKFRCLGGDGGMDREKAVSLTVLAFTAKM